MVINPVLDTKTVYDYELLSANGIPLTLTIDESAGDVVEIDKLVVTFHLTAKPSVTNPDVNLPAEEITVFVNHLLSITKRTREITEVSPDQKEIIKQFIHKLHPIRQ